MLNSAIRSATGRRVTTQTVRKGLRNFAPDVHGEVHLCNHETMRRGADGPNNMPNGPLKIDITFSSPMSVAYAFNQTIVGDVFGGNPVRLTFWGGIM